MKLNDNVKASLFGMGALFSPALYINYATGNVAFAKVFAGVLVANLIAAAFGMWFLETIREPFNVDIDPGGCYEDADGVCSKLCKGCASVYPDTHDYDCPEAQE